MTGEVTKWSASTTTLPLEETSPRSMEDQHSGAEDDDDEEEEEEEGDAAWAAEQSHGRSRKGLRALLMDMEVDHKPSPTFSIHKPQQAEEDSGEEEEGSGGADRMELRLAEERVGSLEARLLDAEETIYHLKAEKMEAWRRVEKLTRSASRGQDVGGAEAEEEKEKVEGGGGGGGGGGGSPLRELRAQVYELQGQLKDFQTQHAVELEEQTAVIREQEREIMVLKQHLAEVTSHAEDVQAQYEQLLATRRREFEYEQKEEEPDDDPLRTLSAAEAPPPPRPLASSSSSVLWQEELIRHPTPHFDLNSPEVQYLLCAWTKNAKKLQYLRTWLTHVSLAHQRELPLDFPMGIELPRLAPEIKDGFLTLVVPLVRKQPWREIQVHTKQYNDGFHADVRIRVVSRRP